MVALNITAHMPGTWERMDLISTGLSLFDLLVIGSLENLTDFIQICLNSLRSKFLGGRRHLSNALTSQLSEQWIEVGANNRLPKSLKENMQDDMLIGHLKSSNISWKPRMQSTFTGCMQLCACLQKTCYH